MAKQVANSDCSSVTVIEENSTESESSTAESVVNTEYSDTHNEMAIRAGLVTSSFVLLLFSTSALVALKRTRSIPKTACILSSSLLGFDCITVFAFAIRNMITDNFVMNILTMIGLSMSCASFVNIAVMSFDRLILFQFPFFYVRRFTNGSYVVFYYVIIGSFMTSYTGQWIVCFVTDKSFWEIRQCMVPLISNYMFFSYLASVLVCLPCFLWIGTIVIKQRRKERSKSESSPTIVVFACCVNYALTTTVIFVLINTYCQTSIIFRRTVTELLYMFNCLADTCVYVLWFKECRYRLLKGISRLCPKFRGKLGEMRNEIFNVSVESTGLTLTNTGTTETYKGNTVAL